MGEPKPVHAPSRSGTGTTRGPVRVLWLTKGLGRGGVERLLVSAVPFLDRARFDVEVAYLLPWKDAFVEELEAQGLVVHCLGVRRIADPRWMGRLRRLVRDGAFDIVHTQMPVPAVAARLVLPERRPTLIHTEHNMWSRYRSATRWANALTYRRNAAVMAVSDAVAASIRSPRFGTDTWPRVEVVRHGADLQAVRRGEQARSEARVRLGLPADVLVIGTVGNFTVKKDHRTLLETFAMLTVANPTVRLVLVGSGPLEAALRETARGLGIESLLTFTGSRDDVFELLAGFDIFVLSSQYEGLPISLLEAMATGLPCVATAVGGIPEVMTDGEEGLLVGPGDPGALAAALGKLLDDPTLRAAMGAAGAVRATQFDIEHAVRRTQDLYDEVVAAR